MLNDRQKERHIAAITSGNIRCNLEGEIVYISNPRHIDRLEGQEIYSQCLQEAELKGVLTEDQLMSEMIKAGVWTKDEEEMIEEMPKEIEDLKVALFKSDGHDALEKGIRKTLEGKKKEFYSLVQKRSEVLKNTSSGISDTVESQYLLYTSVVDREGSFLFKGEDFWEEDLKKIDRIYSQYISSFIPENEMREISRTDPWRSIWNASKSSGSLFGVAASELNKDQKSLINWSRFYDSINESTEAPCERVIKDDDMLDGWVILQSRQREKDKFRRDTDEKASKHPGAGEVGIPVGSSRMAGGVEGLNDPLAQQKVDAIKRAAHKAGNEGKTIKEQDIPFIKKQLRMQAVQESRKGG